LFRRILFGSTQKNAQIYYIFFIYASARAFFIKKSVIFINFLIFNSDFQFIFVPLHAHYVQMRKYVNVQMRKYVNVQMRKYND